MRLSSIACLVVLSLLASGARATADATLYHDATLFTGQGERPARGWFVVSDGAFTAVGRGAPPARWAGVARRVDLHGRFVMPGLVDAHVHFIDGGLSMMHTDLAAVRSHAGLVQAMVRARAHPVNGWVMARNLDLAALDGKLPTHATMAPLTGTAPAYVALKSGHHVYLNRAGLAALGIDEGATDPQGGALLRDAAGHLTGVLVDSAAHRAVEKIQGAVPLSQIAEAILRAQRLALSYGITAIGDNTFFPVHAMQYLRLARRGRFVMRVAVRSWGPVEQTKALMKGIGSDYFGGQDDQIRYFGAKYMVDGSLSASTFERAAARAPGGEAGGEPGGEPHLTVSQLRQALLYTGPFGIAFHVQGRQALERVLAARESVGGRRNGELIDVLDHCGSCSGAVLARIRRAGFRITLLPGQLHELPALTEIYGPRRAARLLRLSEMFAAGLRPALTSDWPLGAPPRVAGMASAVHRMGLAPLAAVAVSVSGKRPDGSPLPGAAQRTISLSEALRGVSVYGAEAIGRGGDLGKIAAGYRADFVVLEQSPFDVDPVKLYRTQVTQTYVAGRLVHSAHDRSVGPVERIERVAPAYGRAPIGWTPSPVIGYDPVPGIIVGGALFFYPYQPRGPLGSVLLMVVPMQGGRFQAAVNAEYLRVLPWLDLRSQGRFDNWRGYYYGLGIDTAPDDPIFTDPVKLDALLGIGIPLPASLEITVDGLWGLTREKREDDIVARGGEAEGPIDGHRLGARLSLQHDTRDNEFSTRRGGLRSLWVEGWALQGSEVRPRGRMGLTVAQFVPLYAPDLVLGLRAQGGVSFGEPAYDTNYALGGIMLLRGYLENRFRGHHYGAAGGELRFPIWSFVSGAAFGETGMVWRDDARSDWLDLALAGGGGLRFGLPPDYLIKLRFDAGAARDQLGDLLQLQRGVLRRCAAGPATRRLSPAACRTRR